MKRSGPLARKTPLPRPSKPLPRGRLNPISKRLRNRDRDYPQARWQVYERAEGRCEVMVAADCTGRCEQVHHLAGRVGPDVHDLSNLLGVCARCHDWIESNRADAYRLGLLEHRNGRAAVHDEGEVA